MAAVQPMNRDRDADTADGSPEDVSLFSYVTASLSHTVQLSTRAPKSLD